MSADPGARPDLSVIVPAWNAAASLGTAIASVLDEPALELECIVVDDGSTDETLAIANELASTDARIVVVSSDTNAGVSAARNLGLDRATGTWLTFLDADDRFLPGGLAAMLAATKGDALAVVGQRISTDGRRTWVPTLYDLPDIRRAGRKSLATNPGLLYYAGPPGKLYHRSTIGGLRFEGRQLGDQPWVLRALLRAGRRIEVIEDVVYEWRRPSSAEAGTSITTAREGSARLGADAVQMAGVAYRLVMDEVASTVESAGRERLAAVYFERLIRADLATQLAAAVRRADPDLGALFTALEGFLSGVPPAVVAASPAVAREFVEPPLRRWHRVPGPARPAYLGLLHAARRADPALATRASGPLGRSAVGLVARRPGALAFSLAEALLVAERLPRRLARLAGLSRSPASPR